ILMPEMWTTGYALSRIRELADDEGKRTKDFLSSYAKKIGAFIVGGSISERRGEMIYNTSYVFDAEGKQVGEYRKIHLFRLMEEEKFLSPGERLTTFSFMGERMGLAICYDLRFPELFRQLALAGAKAILLPAEWPHPRLHHWRTLLAARAIENQMFILAANRTGRDERNFFFGHSLVLSPWGEVVAEGGEGEEILYATIRLDEVEKIRREIPVFEDRRPDLYTSFSPS
ncbi:MAG: carbon-nitrogen family hydrolase, partial [Thermicanus sp.]|nr:carbon-nitrogen family hydrolase [Thermicanus sp.]